MANAGRIIWTGILLAIGTIIAFVGWAIVKRCLFAKKRSRVGKLPGRQPGFITNALDFFGGKFGEGSKPRTNPEIVGPYGNVGVDPREGPYGYIAVSSDSRVPSFLDGATGGVQDPRMPGSAPPQVLGVPGPPGTGAYSAEYQDTTPNLGPIAAYDAKDYLPN
jgi:hypothetical protein